MSWTVLFRSASVHCLLSQLNVTTTVQVTSEVKSQYQIPQILHKSVCHEVLGSTLSLEYSLLYSVVPLYRWAYRCRTDVNGLLIGASHYLIDHLPITSTSPLAKRSYASSPITSYASLSTTDYWLTHSNKTSKFTLPSPQHARPISFSTTSSLSKAISKNIQGKEWVKVQYMCITMKVDGSIINFLLRDMMFS